MKKNNYIWRIMSFASLCKGKMAVAVVFAIASVFGGIVPFFSAYSLIDIAINEGLTVNKVILWGTVCFLGFFVQIICYAISTTFAHVSAYKILEQIRLQIVEKLRKVPLGKITTQSAGYYKDIILDKVGTIELPLAHVIPEVGSSLLLPVAMFIYIATIDFRMALATLATLPICMLPMLSKKSKSSFNEKYAAYMNANNHVNNVIVEYIEGIEVIKTFNQSASSYENFVGAIKSFRTFTMNWYKGSWKYLTLNASVLPSTLMFTVPIGLLLFNSGKINASEYTICCILSLGLIAPLIKLTTYINMAKSIEYAMMSADELLSLPELKDGEKNFITDNYNIVFDNVSFSYGTNENEKLLDKFSLTIPQNSVTALVGPSGGGKSTVAKLINRFWDTDSGQIAIGGVNIADVKLSDLSNQISYITQDNFLFNCSIKENIRMGKLGASDEEVFNAAKAAQCEEIISKLKNGWDTPAGEAGRHLSGGEKQRISLARAILKNAPIIILDEATAFTDPQNEDKIQQSITQLTKGKTLLVIAHRLSTIKNSNQIIVMDKGRISGHGTHEELLQSCSLYERLWDSHVNAKKWAVSTGKEIKNA